jgi:hypothetical protein
MKSPRTAAPHSSWRDGGEPSKAKPSRAEPSFVLEPGSVTLPKRFGGGGLTINLRSSLSHAQRRGEHHPDHHRSVDVEGPVFRHFARASARPAAVDVACPDAFHGAVQ